MMTTKPKIKLLPFHPLVDMFPPMTDDDYANLISRIKEHGQRVEIDTWEGKIIDGKHRALACQKLEIEPRYRERHFGTGEIGAREYVLDQNLARRHLTADQKRELIGKLLQADPTKSDRAVAKATKTDHKTVSAVRAKKEATGEIPQLKKRTGKDGKVRKAPVAKKPKATPISQLESKQRKVEPSSWLAGTCSYCNEKLLVQRIGDSYACNKCLKDDARARAKQGVKIIADFFGQQASTKPEPTPEPEPARHCSFCLRSRQEVLFEILPSGCTAGPPTFVCIGCVAACIDAINEQHLREVISEWSADTKRRAHTILEEMLKPEEHHRPGWSKESMDAFIKESTKQAKPAAESKPESVAEPKPEPIIEPPAPATNGSCGSNVWDAVGDIPEKCRRVPA
jgi:hypothetical protein